MPSTYYSYQDICLKPKYSIHPSRADISVAVELGQRGFKIPVIPANMACTINTELASWMSQNDYFYIMHRFNVDHSHPVNQDNMAFVKLANEQRWNTISISIGVQEDDKNFLRWIIENDYMVDYITIDIAHAHSVRMKEMLSFIHGLTFRSRISPHLIDGERVEYESTLPPMYMPFVIAGNVATPEACNDLAAWGADCVKVGIAQGDACTTYGQTGFGLPMFTCVQECAKVCPVPIIADGGIRLNGDFAKAIVAGGHIVMAGSIFAACKDSPAETVERTAFTGYGTEKFKTTEFGGYYVSECEETTVKKTFKVYYGSASAKNKGVSKHIEGRVVELPCNGMTYAEKLSEITESLQSSISYSGGNLSGAEWAIINK